MFAQHRQHYMIKTKTTQNILIFTFQNKPKVLHYQFLIWRDCQSCAAGWRLSKSSPLFPLTLLGNVEIYNFNTSTFGGTFMPLIFFVCVANHPTSDHMMTWTNCWHLFQPVFRCAAERLLGDVHPPQHHYCPHCPFLDCTLHQGDQINSFKSSIWGLLSLFLFSWQKCFQL